MKTSITRSHRSRSCALLVGAALALTLVAAACVPASDVPTTGATLTVSKSTGLDPAGEVITVTGTGFTTTGNVGTRPPLMGQPAGVYVVFGRFADVWQPSAGADGSGRTIFTQRWALPGSSFATIDALGTGEAVQMDANGDFSIDIEVSAIDGANPNIGIATYAGSGAKNSGEEILVPLEFDEPV
jgi:hypothetical protein